MYRDRCGRVLVLWKHSSLPLPLPEGRLAPLAALHVAVVPVRVGRRLHVLIVIGLGLLLLSLWMQQERVGDCVLLLLGSLFSIRDVG